MEDFKALQQGEFKRNKPFFPTLINRQWSTPPELNVAQEDAAHAIGDLNGHIQRMPVSLDLLAHSYLRKEATSSSRIEGTRTDLDEAFLPSSAIDPERKNDWEEVRRHYEAMDEAVKDLDKLPISSRLLRQLHKKLITDTSKTPGAFRRSQNWVGGATQADAVFTPPPHTEISALMGDLEKFLHNEEITVSPLLRIGMAHYQFETIHPFLDGNGRIGRMLIVLYLMAKGRLHCPMISFSAFCEKDKNVYYDKLRRVSTHNDLVGWLHYFLIGLSEAAQEATNTLDAVLDLEAKHKKLITETLGRRADSGHKLYAQLFKTPLLTADDAMKVCSIGQQAALNLLKAFETIGILQRWSKRKRPLYYRYGAFVDLFAGLKPSG